MSPQTLKRLYDIHSWTGLVCGLVLYAICFSGTVALFLHELAPWEAATTTAPPPASAQAIDKATRTLGTIPSQVILPTVYRPLITTKSFADPNTPDFSHFDPQTGDPAPPATEGAAALLTLLHTDLLLPPPVGRYTVGIMGLVMVFSVVSGVLLHRKLIKELFTLRRGRSRRLAWTDTHKSLGLWGLPFHFVMSLTGAILGLLGWVLLLGAAASFKGDLGAAAVAFDLAPKSAETSAADVPAMPASALIRRAESTLPGLKARLLAFESYGTVNARVKVLGDRPGALVYRPSVTLNAVTGDVVTITDWSRETLGRRIYSMVTPLHYASFGGIAVKILYALLGIGCCILIYSGLHIWRQRGNEQEDGNTVFDKVLVGTCFALPPATAAVFLLARHAPGPGLDSDGLMIAFLGLWALGAATAWVVRPDRAQRHLLRATGLLLAAFPVLTYAATGQHLIDVFAQGALPTAAVDAAGLICGAALLYRPGPKSRAAA